MVLNFIQQNLVFISYAFRKSYEDFRVESQEIHTETSNFSKMSEATDQQAPSRQDAKAPDMQREMAQQHDDMLATMAKLKEENAALQRRVKLSTEQYQQQNKPIYDALIKSTGAKDEEVSPDVKKLISYATKDPGGNAVREYLAKLVTERTEMEETKKRLEKEINDLRKRGDAESAGQASKRPDVRNANLADQFRVKGHREDDDDVDDRRRPPDRSNGDRKPPRRLQTTLEKEGVPPPDGFDRLLSKMHTLPKDIGLNHSSFYSLPPGEDRDVQMITASGGGVPSKEYYDKEKAAKEGRPKREDDWRPEYLNSSYDDY